MYTVGIPEGKESDREIILINSGLKLAKFGES